MQCRDLWKMFQRSRAPVNVRITSPIAILSLSTLVMWTRCRRITSVTAAATQVAMRQRHHSLMSDIFQRSVPAQMWWPRDARNAKTSATTR